MKLNFFTKTFSAIGRWLATALFCVAAVALVWQGGFSSAAAVAAPENHLIAAADLGNKVQGKANQDARNTKGFIRDTADKVERTARKNAARVDRATDGDNFIERRAQNDAARIHKRAEEDASRTQKAVDNTKSAIEQTVDNIKDAFSK